MSARRTVVRQSDLARIRSDAHPEPLFDIREGEGWHQRWQTRGEVEESRHREAAS